jgi:hypothetical protein
MTQQPITIDDIYALFRTSNQEFDRRIAEQERLAEIAKIESDRHIKIIEGRIAKLEEYIVDNYSPSSFIDRNDNWGDFVEKIATHKTANAFLQPEGIQINYISCGVTSYRLESEIEIDILLANDREVLTVMCLPEIHHADIDEFIEKLQKFKLAFPAYKNYQAYGAVAGIEINEGVDRYAYQKGLFVIRPSGDTVEIVNDEKFKAMTW